MLDDDNGLEKLERIVRHSSRMRTISSAKSFIPCHSITHHRVFGKSSADYKIILHRKQIKLQENCKTSWSVHRHCDTSSFTGSFSGQITTEVSAGMYCAFPAT